MIKRIAKCTICLLIVLLSINIFVIGDSTAQQAPLSTERADESIVKILGIDPTSFPIIKITILIDKFCAMSGDLKKEDFRIEEDGNTVAIDNFYFTGKASGQKLDLSVVFDDTNSMQPEIDIMKSKVKDLTDSIEVSGIDANYSLISFENSVSIRTTWTNDPEAFKKEVDALHVISGIDDPENPLDAIEAALSMGFRPDAQKVVLVITDAYAHYRGDGSRISNYTQEEIETDLKESGVIFVVVSPKFEESTGYMDMRDIAEDTKSLWIDIESGDFSAILEEFKGVLTGNYVIEYMSPDKTSFGSRNVTVIVDAPGCVADGDSSSYIITNPNVSPIINDLVALQEKGTNITWTASATDPDGDRILYRFILNSKPMTDWISGNKWTLNANDADVGDNEVEVQIRDGKHKGPDDYDDAKEVKFTLSSMKLMVQKWERTFGGSDTEEGYSVQQTSDGGYIVVGGTISYGSSGEYDAWLIKIDANGNKIWDKTFGGSQDEVGYSVQQTSDGGYIVIAGNPKAYISDNNDAWLIKTDANGNKIWDKTFGGPLNDQCYSVQQTSDGGYILTGSTIVIPEGAYGTFYPDVWLIKTDSLGNKVWDKTFGSSRTDIGNSVQQTRDGGYVITGVWSNNYPSDRDLQGDIWLIKTDSQGNEAWDWTFGGSDWGEAWEAGRSVQQTSDGGYIIGGNIFAVSGWLIKTDAYGNKLWDKTFGEGINIMYDSERSVQQTSDGGYIIITTESGNNAILIKTDSEGNEEFRRTYAGFNIWGHSIQQTTDGGYIVTGASKSDLWLIKTDANGNI